MRPQLGAAGTMTNSPTARRAVRHGKTERQLALEQNDREDRVFGALLEVLEGTPEVLSLEYSDDFLCDLVRSLVPDVSTQDIVRALSMLSARANALREFMQDEDSCPATELSGKH